MWNICSQFSSEFGENLQSMRNLHLDPVFRILEHLCQLGLSGAGLRTVHVLPLGTERQGHQNALVPLISSAFYCTFTAIHYLISPCTRRVQAELGPPVVDEVELGVVTPANELPLPLGVSVPGAETLNFF